MSETSPSGLRPEFHRRRLVPGAPTRERTAILNAFSDPAFVLDEVTGCVVEANDAAIRVTRFDRAEIQGTSISRFLTDGRASPPGLSVTFGARTAGALRMRGGHWLKVAWTAHELPAEHGEGRTLVVLRERCVATEPACSKHGAASVRQDDFPSIVGTSRAILDICRLIGRVARTDSTVLVQGENGTGKEVVADSIHRLSTRASGPFVKVNCAALPETLLESEFFGHVKGAYTGAIQDRKGRFEEATRGTILLDEIGSMSLGGQTRLLRVLQERELEPVGSSRTVKLDVRVIATTNVDLPGAVASGEFREDLYYRLSVISVDLPPLRERREDIPVLAETFLRRTIDALGGGPDNFSPEALSVLVNHAWPGNVRELQNAVEHAVIIEDGTRIEVSSLPARIYRKPRRNGGENADLRTRLNGFEKNVILDTLKRTNWVRKEAALRLGIDPRNFNYFLKKHRIDGMAPCNESRPASRRDS